MNSATFADRLVAWQLRHGRHQLPWQTRDPYLIWLSEIMLQQTQVNTVIPYYEKFVAAFPTVAALAAAPLDTVLAHWSGLGYYQRARNLHRAAQQVMEQHSGAFPATFADLQTLPGIGRSTAAAIAVFAGNERQAILDGNVRRVLARHRGIVGDPAQAAVQTKLWQLAEILLPEGEDIGPYTQGLMDLGSLICTRRRPHCTTCPIAADCVAQLENRQEELPSARRRPTVTERQVVWLMLRHENEVYLEQRPPSGIWGGLWTLPEFADDAAANSWLGRWCNPDLSVLAEISHRFTHLQLTARVYLADLPVVPGCAAESAGHWFSTAGLSGIGLPQPVTLLLQQHSKLDLGFPG